MTHQFSKCNYLHTFFTHWLMCVCSGWNLSHSFWFIKYYLQNNALKSGKCHHTFLLVLNLSDQLKGKKCFYHNEGPIHRDINIGAVKNIKLEDKLIRKWFKGLQFEINKNIYSILSYHIDKDLTQMLIITVMTISLFIRRNLSIELPSLSHSYLYKEWVYSTEPAMMDEHVFTMNQIDVNTCCVSRITVAFPTCLNRSSEEKDTQPQYVTLATKKGTKSNLACVLSFLKMCNNLVFLCFSLNICSIFRPIS